MQPSPHHHHHQILHPRNIYVASLPSDCSEQRVRSIFEPFGEIEIIRIIPGTRPNGFNAYGFVMFKDSDSASKAIQGLMDQCVDGSRIQVRRAKISETQRQSAIAAASAASPPPSQPALGLCLPPQGSAIAATTLPVASVSAPSIVYSHQHPCVSGLGSMMVPSAAAATLSFFSNSGGSGNHHQNLVGSSSMLGQQQYYSALPLQQPQQPSFVASSPMQPNLMGHPQAGSFISLQPSLPQFPGSIVSNHVSSSATSTSLIPILPTTPPLISPTFLLQPPMSPSLSQFHQSLTQPQTPNGVAPPPPATTAQQQQVLMMIAPNGAVQQQLVSFAPVSGTLPAAHAQQIGVIGASPFAPLPPPSALSGKVTVGSTFSTAPALGFSHGGQQQQQQQQQSAFVIPFSGSITGSGFPGLSEQ